jgi:SOS response regulatory protein OraA/RecX
MIYSVYHLVKEKGSAVYPAMGLFKTKNIRSNKERSKKYNKLARRGFSGTNPSLSGDFGPGNIFN